MKKFIKCGIILVLMFKLNDSMAMDATTDMKNSANYEVKMISGMEKMHMSLAKMKDGLEKMKNKDVVKDEKFIDAMKTAMNEEHKMFHDGFSMMMNDSKTKNAMKPIIDVMQKHYDDMVKSMENCMKDMEKAMSEVHANLKK